MAPLIALESRVLAIAALAVALLAAPALGAEGPASREYQVKAAFILNFAQYVEWPETAFAAPDAPLRIGVLGDDPFGRTIDATVAGEKVRGHPIEIVRSADVARVASCHVVFVASGGRPPDAAVLAGLGGPVLTVGDDEAFARRGGTIGFFLDRGRVRFAINPAAAKDAGLKLAAALLNLGKIVADARGGSP